MQVSETLSEGLKREFKLFFPAAEIEELIDNRVGELLPTLNLPGFRRGKVPAALVKRRFGPAIRGEVLEKLLEDSSRNALTERALTPMGQPQLAVTSYEEGGDLECTLSLELRPNIDPIDFSAIALDRLTVEDSDAAIREAIHRQARGRALSEQDGELAVQGGDRLVVDLVGRIDGETFPQGDRESCVLEAGGPSPDFPGLGEAAVGLSVREPAPVTITYPNDFKWPHLAGKEAVFQIYVRTLDRPMEVTEDLAQETLGYEDAEDYRVRMQADRARHFETAARGFLKRSLLDRLDELCDFEVPEGLVQGEYESICGVWRSSHPVAAALTAAPDADGAERPGGEPDAAGEAAGAAEPAAEAAPEDPDPAAGDGGRDSPDGGDGAAAPPMAADDGMEEWRKAALRKTAVRRVKLGLILDETARLNNISVSETERTMIRNQFGAGNASAGPQAPAAPEWMVQSIVQQVFEDKVVEFVLELATVNDRTIAADAFEALVQERDVQDWTAEVQPE